MRSFNKLANLHRVFFKRAQGDLGGFMGSGLPLSTGPEKYPGEYLAKSNPANDQGPFFSHNNQNAHPGPGQGRGYTGIEYPQSVGVSPLYRAQGKSAIPAGPGRAPAAPAAPALPAKSSVMPGPNDVDPRMPGNSLPQGTDLRTYYNK